MGRNCKYCGAYVSGELDVCPACGRPVVEGSGCAEEYTSKNKDADRQKTDGGERKKSGAESGAYTYKQEYDRRYGGAESGGDAAYTAVETDGDSDVRRNKSISYLCYFGFLFLVPYLLHRDSDFVRFHSNQGLLLFIADMAVGLLGNLPVIGWLINMIGGIFIVVCFIKGLMSVSRGQKNRLPIIGEIEILK